MHSCVCAVRRRRDRWRKQRAVAVPAASQGCRQVDICLRRQRMHLHAVVVVEVQNCCMWVIVCIWAACVLIDVRWFS